MLDAQEVRKSALGVLSYERDLLSLEGLEEEQELGRVSRGANIKV